MKDALEFIVNTIRYPHRMDFARMGLGMKARAKASKKFWEQHFKCSQTFLRTAAPPANSIAILGAGRLYDVDTQWLLQSFREVHLVDYDPGCRRAWKRLKRRAPTSCAIHEHPVDVTGCLEDWSSHLRHGLRAHRDLSALLKELPEISMNANIIPKVDVVVSLNLLSQIPLYWRDRVIVAAAKSGLNEEKMWDTAGGELEASMDVLQESHLKSLFLNHPPRVIVITDTEFYYYRPDVAEWQVEPAISNTARTTLSSFERHEMPARDSWLWHLAPFMQGTSEFGEIHRVEAFAYSLLDHLSSTA